MQTLKTRWHNDEFFTSSADPAIQVTVENLRKSITELKERCLPFVQWIEAAEPPTPQDHPELINQLADVYHQQLSITRTLRNTSMYIHSCLSVNAKDAAAATSMPTLQQLGAQLQSAVHPMYGFIARADDALIHNALQNDVLAPLQFTIEQLRVMSDQLLSVEQEQLLTGLAVTGLHGWGNLYKNLAGTLHCTVGNEQLGLAAAANKLSDSDSTTREQAWRGINNAWNEHEHAVAAILNNINGWRIEESSKRSHTRNLHYLDKSCHSSKIKRETLDSMLQATYEHRHLPQQALATIAQVLNVDKAGPWDLMAPAPGGSNRSIAFEDAIQTIADAFAAFSPDMGAFAIEMAERGWIDCEQTDNRSTGAYCGAFAEPRQPRVFITYELGHAWHNRVMEDIPEALCSYPMTLAETASIFAETLVRDALMENAQDDTELLEICWSDAITAAALMLNIPARFHFEKALVEARTQQFVTPEQLKASMRSSWQHWYEDSLSEYDDMFWASKLHFSISGFGFYNYPYLFGYLFSLGIYAQKDNSAADFTTLYRNILRDTGSMTAEGLVQKHLQKDITKQEFWDDSIAIVASSLKRFEALATHL